MNNETFQKLLQEQYNSDVVLTERFQTIKSSMLFHCTCCGTDFYNRGDYVLSSNQHRCLYNHADYRGSRTKIQKSAIKKNTIKKKLSTDLKKEIDAMYNQGVYPRHIALNLGINIGTTLYYLSRK